MNYGPVLGLNAVLIVLIMASAWRLSLGMGRADIVDVVWPLGFVAVGWTTWLVTDGAADRADLLVTMATVWGLRLAGHLAWRMRGKPEDRRYQAMRRRHAERFEQVSLFSVFLFQGLLMWIVSLPLQVGPIPDAPERIGVAGVLGVALFGVGMFFETVGDWQLARFKSKPWNEGQVMQAGLWRYTRHPNYFGDFCVWWGIFLVAATSGPGFASVPGPVLMTILLMRVSGVPLTEAHMKKRPGYTEYAARTNAFFPGPPGGGSVGPWE